MAFVCFAFAGCSSDDKANETEPEQMPESPTVQYEIKGKVVLDPLHEFSAEKLAGEMTQEEIAVGNAVNKFGMELFSRKSVSGENTVLSPMSVAYALSMATVGADGDTRAEILNAMQMSDNDMDNVNAYNYKKMKFYANNTEIDSYREGGDTLVQVEISNSLWMNPSFLVYNSFVNDCKNYYASDVYNTLDNRQINAWVENATKGMITDVPAPGDIEMALINATYFRGSWEQSFEERATRKAVFHNTKGKDTEVDMMHQTSTFRYLATDKASIVELPYGYKRNASMYVVLPNEGVDVMDVCNARTLNSAINESSSTLVQLDMPKFRVESGGELVSHLNAMGCRKAFTPMADFSKLTPGSMSIGNILTQAVVEVDEKGTVAAAVTMLMESSGIGETPQPVVMNVNRPFLFFIVDRQGTLMFIGKVEKL